MLGWSINLFRIRGIQLALHFSFVLLLAYVAVDGYREYGMPGLFWTTGLLLAFFTCVVLHELGHCFAALHFKVGVRRILLMPIGGMAEFDAIPREPSRELRITLAGPAVNFAVAAALLPFASLPAGWLPGAGPGSPVEFGRHLLAANLVMGGFNLVPVFPMDGGRIFRALLAIRLPYVRATFWAASTGKVLAGIAVLLALSGRPESLLDGRPQYLLAALFAFIFLAGEAEYRALLGRELAEARWRETLARCPQPSVPPGDEPPFLVP